MAAQLTRQAPQWLLSLRVSTQLPLQQTFQAVAPHTVPLVTVRVQPRVSVEGML
jgi:hypothetical protein